MKKFLLADDSFFMRTWLKTVLRYEYKDITFIEADNGYKAIEMYKLHSPDCVLMDITMPELNGIETLKEIINFDSKARVIMCSSLGQKGFINDSIKIGAKDFIVKPNFKNLVSIVSKYI